MKWSSKTVKLDTLSPAKYNPRRMNDRQRGDLKDSLDRFDLVDPLIINTNGTIIGGHQRYKMLSEQGALEVDVRVPERELTLAEEKELNLRLNKNQGEFDMSLLTGFDPEMLVGVGFDAATVDEMFELAAADDVFDEEKEYASIEQPQTKVGDIYEFPGGHRLLCGDASLYGDVERLMDGALADLIYTDPPYNVAYKGKKFSKIANDDMKDEEFIDWLAEVFSNALAVSHEHVNLYCWFAMGKYPLFRTAIERAGWRYMQVTYWLKERFVLAMGQYYHRITEPCMIFYRDWNKKYVNYKYAKNTDIWDMDRLTFEENLEVWYQHRDKAADYEHPTQKPVRLAERAIKKNSEVGHIVLDLFVGGGAALLCAHQLSRRCYAMEIDPKYCDVVVKRFELMTGTKARRI